MEAELQPLHDALAQTFSPDPAAIKQAEAILKAAQAQPGFGISILKLVTPDSVQLPIRQQGAVQFKNFVKFNWAPRDGSDDDGGAAAPTGALRDDEKEQIKAHIIDLMLSAPPRVRAQLSEALTIISATDFPRRWEGLLPQLITKLGAEDPTVLNGVLTTADSIYQRYRGQFLSAELNEELQYSQALVRPLLVVTQRVTAACATAAAGGGGAEALPVLLDNARLCLSIFHSLNSPGLTEEFENTLKEWMDCIHGVLSLPPGIAAPADPEEEGPGDAAKAAACECLSLFMALNEEEFAPHLETCVRDVWQLLVAVGPATGQDNLCMAAVTFLTTVARSVHAGLFGDASVLKQVCEGIVIPNLRLRDEDTELFEMNWVEWVRRDTEGGDADTRRRAASELVRALVAKFPAQSTELFSGYVTALLAEAAAAPDAAWRSKDAAIYLVSALAVKGRTAAAGATSTNKLVNLQEFYAAHVAPELAAADVDARPLVKADCLRFATTFRSQLPAGAALDLFPKAAAHLASTHNVVHTYAAVLVERLLATRAPGGAPAFTPDQLAPYLQALLERLFGALRLPESGENEYVMRAVMRLVAFCGAAIAPVAPAALKQLSDVLLGVARNPTHPGFNHYLFESIAALVKYGSGGGGDGVAAAEGVLFPPFQIILQEDVQEFHPYVFQVLAQLVEMRGGGLPETYLALLPPLLTPTFWERPGNVPALGRLLRAYVNAAPGEIAARGMLPGVLGVFQKLVASKANDHEGMALLDALTGAVDPVTLGQYMPTVWQLLFQRLQVAHTSKMARCFLHSAALLAARRGGAAAAESMDSVQPGIHVMVAQSILAPALAGAGTAAETKVAVVGCARLLAEAPGLQAPAVDAAAGALLASLSMRSAGAGDGKGEGEGDGGDGGDGDGEEFSGYSAAYAKLHNATEVDKDPLHDVVDAGRDVAGRIAAWSAAAPGRVGRLLAGAPDAATALAALAARAGVAIS